MNQLKIENIKPANAVNAPADALKIEEKAEDTLTDVSKQAVEPATKATTKHVIVYIGGSAYTDSTGRKWARHDEHTYSEEEYENRTDLHFMVKYGEMKHTVVTI